MLGAGIPKGLIHDNHICLRKENLSFDNNNTSNKEAHILHLNSPHTKLLGYIMARTNYVLMRRSWNGFA
jgi:hypothetical protein